MVFMAKDVAMPFISARKVKFRYLSWLLHPATLRKYPSRRRIQ